MTDQREDNVAGALDSLLPESIALAAENVGVRKARADTVRLAALAVLAGAFIGLGALFSSVAGIGADALPFGIARVVAGVTFSLGLVLVLLGGAELFTGNSLMVMALAAGRIRTPELARAWAIVYAGNFVGAAATAVLVYLAGLADLGHGELGANVVAIAGKKAALPFGQALVLGLLCNVLVCLAVWLSLGARTATGKVAVIVPPITAFVAAGFEHSIANMYYFPLAMLIEPGHPDITVGRALGNLIPVTLGNILGGAGLVGLVYWFVYLRPRRAST